MARSCQNLNNSKAKNGVAIFCFAKKNLLGLVFKSQKCGHTFVI
jgi:hypothetical protein